ncbi:MAG: MarR family transcriptional regulator [Firmicutes bacterium]|nr:MarR family transcriptional regulator [Bacillota bacterium]
MELKECINFLLTNAQHNVFQYLSKRLTEYDVTPVQHGVLSCLMGKSYDTPKHLAESMSLETSTISGVLDRMQKKGLIDRVINKEDRREVQVRLTDKGRELEEKITVIIDEVNAEVLKSFSEEEVASLKDFLRAIASDSFGE